MNGNVLTYEILPVIVQQKSPDKAFKKGKKISRFNYV
jgi:hypothetical protein